MSALPSTPKGLNTRRRIVDAAIDLFAHNGYHATTINEIGLKSGVGRGALYHHIKAKEDLLFEVLREHVEAVLAAAREIEAATDLEPAEKLRRLLRSHAETILEHRHEVTIYERDARALTGERAAQLREIQAQVEDVWVRLFAEGVQAETLRPVDPVALKGIIGMVNSAHNWFRPEGRLTAEEIGEALADVAFRGLEI